MKNGEAQCRFMVMGKVSERRGRKSAQEELLLFLTKREKTTENVKM